MDHRHDGVSYSRGTFPLTSLVWFVLGAAILRALAVVAWGVFPGVGIFPRVARVLVPLCVAIGLVVLNERLLARDGFPRDVLGLALRRIGWFFAGGLVVVPIILTMAGALWLVLPFHWERGAMTWSQLGWQTAEYCAGNFAEELTFRGYLLIVLARHLGLMRALTIVALLFGAFHLPGLSGWAALKMICTTATWSFIFAAGYFLTGSIWMAVGLHVVGNVFLHHVVGMSGSAAIARPVFEGPWPTSYDPAFWVTMAVGVPVAAGASILMRRQPSLPFLRP